MHDRRQAGANWCDWELDAAQAVGRKPVTSGVVGWSELLICGMQSSLPPACYLFRLIPTDARRKAHT